MSSIFTFNPSPPKPASPWANNTPIHPSPSTTPNPLPTATESISDDTPGHLKTNSNSGRFRGSFIDANHKRWGEGIATDDGGTVRGLVSEPQMGPTEYKLSLIRGGKSEARMDQLTTQLLWRLQQSSPYHGNSLTSKSPGAISSLLQESQGALYEIGVADDGTFVGLSEEELHASLDTLRGMAARLGCSVTVVRKVCVGTVDEREIKRAEAKLAEYIKARQRNQKTTKMNPEDNYNTTAETVEGADTEKFGIPRLGDSLWVAEAFVKPGDGSPNISANVDPEEVSKLPETKSNTEQLRITLTGATTCGKTTLLGTLSTGELDNGRGKSRLSLLRHRHELVSGITSSVAWEIVGYRPEPDTGSDNLADESGASRIVNYASGNISSWTDIHASAVDGRIAFLSDSAGNTRFIKATFRSLIGWAPHYAAYLIAANSEDDSGGVSGHGVHAHLTLCTKLGLRMLVIITKMDLASKTGLKKVFSSVLTYLKDHGKKPALIPSMKTLKDVVRDVEKDPEHVVPILFTSSVKGDGIDLLHALIASLPLPESLRAPAVERVIEPLPGTSLVGVTTGTENISVVDNGEGMTVKVDVIDDKEELPSTLFHVEEIYGIQPAYGSADTDGGAVVGGHVRYGKISIGDELVIGPFPPINSPPSRSGTPTPTATPIQNLNLSTSAGRLSRQFSKSPDSGDERRVRMPRRTPTPNSGEDEMEGISGGEFEWKTLRVISVRRLRLPVNTLYAGEAGTLGVVPISEESSTLDPVLPIDIRDINSKLRITIEEDSDCSDGIRHISGTPKSAKAVTFANPPPTNIHHAPMKLRRGVVILNRPSTKLWPKAHTGFTTKLEDPDACHSLVIGSSVMVYIASIRVAARVASIEPPPPPVTATKRKDKIDDVLGVFSLDDEFDSHSEDEHMDDDDVKERLYNFEFNHRAEWIEEGATVLIMPGGGEKGLEAFVGKVLNRLV